MTREEAIKEIKMWGIEAPRQRAVLETLIPELAESEDERIRKGLIELIENWNYPQELFTTKRNIIAWLEKQKEQKPDDDPLDDPKFLKGFDTGREVQRIFDEQKPAEWSEGDEHRRKDAIYFLESAKRHYADTSEIEKTIAWLKSLRPSWKPSEEQMDAIDRCVDYLEESDNEDAEIMESLQKQLHKLM